MNILNIEELTVLEIKEDRDYFIVAEMASPPSYCPHCGCVPNLQGFGGKTQLIMDTPSHGKRVGISLRRKRYRCKECTRTFMEPLKFVDESRSMTKRLVEYIEKQSLKRTFTSLSEEIGLDEKTIRNVFKDYAKELEKHLHFATPVWLGIDEAHLLHNFRCVISNVKDKTILEMLKERSKPTVISYLSRLPDKDRVEIVCMDMWQPYRDAANATLPHAKVVIDKFHVVKGASIALEGIRKSIRQGLTDKQRKTLMHDRFTLLKRKSSLKPFEQMKLESWTANYPELGLAYKLKEDFYEIFDDSKDRYEAYDRYQAWKGEMPSSMVPHFEPLMTSMRNWEPEILNYFELPSKRATNAYTEALNGLIKIVNRNGRGYSFDVLRAKILFTEGVQKVKRNNYKHKDTAEVGANIADGDLESIVQYMLENFDRNPGETFSTLTQDMTDEEKELFST